MKAQNKILSYCIAVIISIIIASCSLTPEVFNELPTDEFPTNLTQLDRTINPAYVTLRYMDSPTPNDWMPGILMSAELTTDNLVLLTRGGDWFNGGIFKRLSTHTWNAIDGPQNDIWIGSYGAISKINLILYQLSQTKIEVPGLKQKIAELKVLRAFWYYQVFDGCRNIFIKTDFTDVTPAVQVDPKTAFNFIEKEIKDNMDALAENNDATTYGLMTKGAARALLAKLYINAEVYIGQAKWQECLDQCNAIINSNQYDLFKDGFVQIFADDNDKNGASKENILVVPNDVKYPTGFSGSYPWMIHFNSAPTFHNGYGGMNAISCLSAFVRLYKKEDLRRKQAMLEGQQYSWDGKIALTTRQGSPLNFTIDYSVDDPWNDNGTGGAKENEGVRALKYVPAPTITAAQQGNDFVIYRYADILLMKAEVLLRTGLNSNALPLMNQVRLRSLPSLPFVSVNLDSVYVERKREFVWEGFGRQDMIRFGKFEGTWQFHPVASDPSRRIFPIPQDVLTVNPSLKQNPGY